MREKAVGRGELASRAASMEAATRSRGVVGAGARLTVEAVVRDRRRRAMLEGVAGASTAVGLDRIAAAVSYPVVSRG